MLQNLSKEILLNFKWNERWNRTWKVKQIWETVTLLAGTADSTPCDTLYSIAFTWWQVLGASVQAAAASVAVFVPQEVVLRFVKTVHYTRLLEWLVQDVGPRLCFTRPKSRSWRLIGRLSAASLSVFLRLRLWIQSSYSWCRSSLNGSFAGTSRG